MRNIKIATSILALALSTSAIAATSPTLAVAHEAWRLEQNCGLARGNVVDAESDDQGSRKDWIKAHVPAGKKAAVVACEIGPGNVVYSASWLTASNREVCQRIAKHIPDCRRIDRINVPEERTAQLKITSLIGAKNEQ